MTTFQTTRRALLLGAAAATTLTLALAPSAHADSISFLRGGNVWVASADGAQQVQVTTDGGYSYASRADDGTFIALRGRRLRKIAPTGQVIADFDTPVSGEQTAPNTSFFRGPFKPEISPDGTKVAYEYWHQAFLSDPGCAPVGTPTCTDKRVSVGIGYSHSDRQTSWDEPGMGRQSGWLNPSWIDNGTLMQSGKSVLPNVDVIIDRPGDGNQTIERWFEDTGAWHVRDGEVSRRGDAAAFISTQPRHASDPHWGQEDDQVTIYRMNGAPPALPEQCFSFQNPDAIYVSPTFSPDGGRVAWETHDRDGSAPSTVLVGAVPSQAAGCQSPTAGGQAILTDATGPDWSPAPVPAIVAGGGGPSGGAGGGSGAGPQSGGGAASGGVTVSLSSRALGRALVRGLPVRVQVPGAGRVRVTALRSGKRVGEGSAKAKTAGTVKLRLRLTASARRALRRGGSSAITLRYRFTPKAGPAIVGTTTVQLRR